MPSELEEPTRRAGRVAAPAEFDRISERGGVLGAFFDVGGQYRNV